MNQPAPDVAGLLQMLEASDAPPMTEGTPEQAREGFRLLMVHLRPVEAAITGVTASDDTVAGFPARVYRPDGVSGPLPTVAFLHGGGFVIGDLDTHDPLCRLIARDCEAVVVAVDYPLAPESPFPAAVDAALDAVREIHERRLELGGDDRVAVAGDSAGGNLAAVAAQELRDLPLSAQLLMYPKTDTSEAYPSLVDNGTGYFLDTPTIDWFSEQYVGVGADVQSLSSDLRLAPLQGDLSGLAPAVVATAEFDPLRDEGEAYAAALVDAGVTVDAKRYDGQIHGFANMDHLAPSAKAATDDMLARFRVLLHP
jgi:acetyl esterase